MSTQKNQCNSFQTLLQFHIKKAGFRHHSKLADQITKHCQTPEGKQIRVSRSTICRWLKGQHVARQNEHGREMLICICKLLSIKSIQEINELLESSGHEKLTLAEQQKEFPQLPLLPAESTSPANSSIPETPGTAKPPVSLDSADEGELRPAEPKEDITVPQEDMSQCESSPVDQPFTEKHRLLLIASALLTLGVGILISQSDSPPSSQSSEFSINILYPQNGQRCPHSVPISGTVTNLPANWEFWVVKEAHPGNYHPDVGPAIVKEQEWRGIAFIGNRGVGADTNLEFLIHIVLASHETGRRFQEYLDAAHKTGSWIGVTTLYDGKIVGSVKVIRDDSVSCKEPDFSSGLR